MSSSTSKTAADGLHQRNRGLPLLGPHLHRQELDDSVDLRRRVRQRVVVADRKHVVGRHAGERGGLGIAQGASEALALLGRGVEPAAGIGGAGCSDALGTATTVPPTYQNVGCTIGGGALTPGFGGTTSDSWVGAVPPPVACSCPSLFATCFPAA